MCITYILTCRFFIFFVDVNKKTVRFTSGTWTPKVTLKCRDCGYRCIPHSRVRDMWVCDRCQGIICMWCSYGKFIKRCLVCSIFLGKKLSKTQ